MANDATKVKIDGDYIFNWCEANNQLEWLVTISEEKIKAPVYPRKEYKTKDGKVKTKPDNTQAPIKYEERVRNFMEVKAAFIDKFMPELKPKAKQAKPSLLERAKTALAAKKP